MKHPFLLPALGAACLLLSFPNAALLAQGPPAMLVETATIAEMEFHDQLTLVGRTQARAESRIVAEVAGRVASVDAEEGRSIRRGAALLSLDCRRTELALEAKRAEAARAQVAAQLAEKELQRAQELLETNVLPQRVLDTAETDAAGAQAQVRGLDAEIRRLELDLENCVIRAPYSGYTLRRLVDVGEWVEIGTPVWETVDLSVVTVTVDLPERRFGDLELGSDAKIVLDNGTTVSGKVSGIARRASETTHTFPVLIEVDNHAGTLAGGMLVRATLDLRETFRGLAVSKDAIVRDDSGTSVYTVQNDLAVKIPVRIRAESGEMVAIEAEAVSAGQALVVRGNERLFPGSPVRVQ